MTIKYFLHLDSQNYCVAFMRKQCSASDLKNKYSKDVLFTLI